MKIVFNPNEGTYTNVDNKPRTKSHDSEKKVVAGGGAIAAAASTKATKSGFDMFNSARNVSNGMQTVTNTTRTVGEVAKKSKGLMAKVASSAKWAKNAILNWGKNFEKIKWLKPLMESKLFKFGAGFMGYGFGVITLIAGLADIGRATTETLERNFSQDA